MKHKPTGWVTPQDRYAVPALFNPYTGEPRDVRDVQSDPQGQLITPPGRVYMLAATVEAPQSAQQIPEPPTEYGWLLEYRPDVSSNVYWLGRNLRAEFDAFEALRFGTKADAEAFLKLMIGPVRQLGDGSDWLAVEHAFDGKVSKEVVRLVQVDPPYGTKRKAAMAVYTPPFKFQRGYIFDSQQLMVADDDNVDGAVAARVRGWGRLSYLPNGAELQDEIGQMMADALNAYYASPQPPQQIPADVAKDAARYRWLRNWKGQEHEPPFTVQHELDGILWGGDLDTAIDAAMQGEQQ